VHAEWFAQVEDANDQPPDWHFRQINKDKSAAHHDALEFPDGRTVLLTFLCEGQAATVPQLAARPVTAAQEDVPRGASATWLTVQARGVWAALWGGLASARGLILFGL
jgi:hypothetical protein